MLSTMLAARATASHSGVLPEEYSPGAMATMTSLLHNSSSGFQGATEDTLMPPDPDPMMLAVRHLQLYGTPALTGVGILGNIMCGVLLMGGHIPLVSSTHYILGLLITDTVQLTCVLHDWLTQLGIQVYSLGGWCHFVTFARNISEFLSTWYLVALSVDRFITTCFKEKRSCFCTVCKARVTIIAVAVAGTVVYLNTSLNVWVYHYGEMDICTTLPMFETTARNLGHADTFVNGLLPMLVLITLTSCMLVSFWLKHKRGSSPRTVPILQGVHRLHATHDNNSELLNNKCHTYAALSLIVLHVFFVTPLIVFRMRNSIGLLYNPESQMSLPLFLQEQLLVFTTNVKMALQFVVLLLTHSLLRENIARVACSRRQAPSTHWTPSSVCCCVGDSDSRHQAAMDPTATRVVDSGTEYAVLQISAEDDAPCEVRGAHGAGTQL